MCGDGWELEGRITAAMIGNTNHSLLRQIESAVRIDVTFPQNVFKKKLQCLLSFTIHDQKTVMLTMFCSTGSTLMHSNVQLHWYSYLIVDFGLYFQANLIMFLPSLLLMSQSIQTL